MTDLTHTWDGLEIAADDPRGATVVVRRRTTAGAVELLLLHRNHYGPDYEGDWAWTAPAGSRQPGEAVYPAALRELAEEAGLTGLDVFALDLSLSAPPREGLPPYHWAIFGADVERETEIDLVDPEHDRYEWLPPEACRERLLPGWVADGQVGRGSSVPTIAVSFRPMRYDDLTAVVAWQQAPHAARWFHGDAMTPAAARERYGPRIEGEHPTRMWVVEIDGLAVGYVQAYRVGDYDEYAVKTGDPDAIGFDYVLGDPALVGQGIGTRMIWTFCRDVLVPSYPDAPRFVASPDHRNAASLRALAKCGFVAGNWIDAPSVSGEGVDTEVVCTLDRAHWFGPGRDLGSSG